MVMEILIYYSGEGVRGKGWGTESDVWYLLYDVVESLIRNSGGGGGDGENLCQANLMFSK